MIQRSRHSRRSERPRPYAVVLAGLVTVGALALAGIIAVRAPNGVPGVPSHTYFASVPDPGNIQPHNDVRIAGVRVGQVLKVEARDQRAHLELKLAEDTERLPADTQVFVRAAGLLGQRYVELRPGRSTEQLPERATIHGDEGALTYSVPDALNTFDERTRRALASTLDETGIGLLGRGRGLSRLTDHAVVAGPQFNEVVERVVDDRPGAARRLVPALTSAIDALESGKDDQVAAMGPAARTFDAIVQRRSALGETLEEAPSALGRVRTGLDTGTRLLHALREVADAANRTLPAAPEGLRATAALLHRSDRPLRRTAALLATAQAAVPDARRLVSSLRPVLEPGERLLDDLVDPLQLVGRHGCDVDNFAENWRSALGYGIEGRAQTHPLPNGFIGPLHYFRILPPFTPAGIQGITRDSPMVVDEVHPGPCKYSPGKRYIETPTRGGSR
ncbi:MlaD family protein [Conexibacter sp. SYSU D00693]|uniref:MlaD family protein n=1 Tax=Conexibacter sp. SYSU D00693 TaxID=2812560 RepID=UPI00196ADA88|nr:MlaD family protein [Conexibacter sp. SYSU D00693]